jgi:hypothetical protein
VASRVITRGERNGKETATRDLVPTFARMLVGCRRRDAGGGQARDISNPEAEKWTIHF